MPLRAAKQCCFVHNVGQIGTDAAAGDRGNLLDVDIVAHANVLQVNLQDFFAARNVGTVDQHVAIEASRSQQRWVECFGPIGGGHHNHSAVTTETIHLDEQGVERLLALVVSTNLSATTGLAEGIQLVDENDARGAAFGLAEHVANAGGTHTNKHFDKVGTAKAEERHTCFAGNRLGEQGLTGTGGTDEQHALRDATTKALVPFWVLEEVDDFPQLVDCFVDAGNFFEGDFDIFLGDQLTAATAEGHGRTRPAHAAEHDDHQQQQHAREHEDGEIAEQCAGLIGIGVFEIILAEQLLQCVFVGQAGRHESDLLLLSPFAILCFDFHIDFTSDLETADLDVFQSAIPLGGGGLAAGVLDDNRVGNRRGRLAILGIAGDDELLQIGPNDLLFVLFAEKQTHQEQQNAETQHVPN